MEDLLITTFAESDVIADAADEVEKAVWSSLGYLNFSKPFVHYFDLMERYPDYQVAVVDRASGYVVATGNMIPLYHADPTELPDGGWDWAIECAAKTVASGVAPNMVVALSVSVPRAYRSRGLARLVLGAMRNLVESRGLAGPFTPVRPNGRERHLDVDPGEYARWRRADNTLFDPWLRTHESIGGRQLGVCRTSMVIEKPVGFWEAWSGQVYEQSGAYPIAGGLAPVMIDLDKGTGSYVEPNIWYAYD